MTSERDAHVEIPLSERRWSRDNPPNQTRLAARACQYTETLQRMLGRLPLVTVQAPDGTLHAPLQRLNARSGDDWTVGILHAWAVTADVLSFYQERIVNEGFIGTASERKSVMEMVRMLGYEMRPGVAAGTYLAFHVVEDEESPDRQIEIPAGTAVQSVPTGDELPQTFETGETMQAHVAWNAIPFLVGVDTTRQRPDQSEDASQSTDHVVTAAQEPVVDLSVNGLRILGSNAGLLPADHILLIARDHSGAGSGNSVSSAAASATDVPTSNDTAPGEVPAVQADPSRVPFHRGRLAEVDDVQVDAARGWTELHWKPAEDPSITARIEAAQPGVYAFKQPTTLFAFQPTGMEYLAKDSQKWAPAGIGLPAIPITAVVRLENGTLLAASEEDVYRSTNGGATWHAFPTGGIEKKIRALAAGEGGGAYAGSDEGDLFRSVDGKEAWRLMSGGPPAPPPSALEKALKLIPRPGAALKRLPEAPIRSLAEYRDGKQLVLVAGTDEGVFRSTDQGRTWIAADNYLPKSDAGGATKTPVTATAVIPKKKKKGSDVPVVATPVGVFTLGKAIRHRWVLALAAVVFGFLQIPPAFEIPTEIGKLLPPSVAAAIGPAPDSREEAEIVVAPNTDTPAPTSADLLADMTGATPALSEVAAPEAAAPDDATPGVVNPDGANPADTTALSHDAEDATGGTPAGEDAAATRKGVLGFLSAWKAWLISRVTGQSVDEILQGDEAASGVADDEEESNPDAPSDDDAQKGDDTKTGGDAKAGDEVESDDDGAGEGGATEDGDAKQDGDANPVTEALDGLVDLLPESIRTPYVEAKLKQFSAPLANLASVIGSFYAVIFAFGRVRQMIQKRPASSLGKQVESIRVTSDRRILAGTAEGVFRSWEPGGAPQAPWWRKALGYLLRMVAGDAARRWKVVLPGAEVRSLCVTADETLVAATSERGPFSSTDMGETWQPADDGFGLAETAQLLATDDGVFAAGTPADADAESRWSPWQIKAGQLKLSDSAPSVAPKSWLLLTSEEHPEEMWFRQVNRVSQTESHDAARPGPVTTLVVDGLDRLPAWDRTRVSVWTGGNRLELGRPTPVFGQTFTTARPVSPLQPGRKVFVRGRRLRGRVHQDTSARVPLLAEDGGSIELANRQWLTLLSAPHSRSFGGSHEEGVAASEAIPDAPPADTPRDRYFAVKTDGGVHGWLAERNILFEPARPEDPVVSELRTIKSTEDEPRQNEPDAMHVHFDVPLEACYDADTLVLHGNVAHATHGETVASEVLGSSDGKAAYQQYALAQTGPQDRLTFVSAPTPSGVAPTLSVTVNGIQWHQVDALTDAAPSERVYVLRQNDTGRASIAFGDGHESARIPSNREEVVATYRVGLGPAGNVPAGSLTTFTAGPAGIDDVLNPMAAVGGVGPEEIGQAVARAALHTKSFGRLVSLSDFETFAANFGGVGRASARLFHLGNRSLLHVSIADGNGLPLPDDADILSNLSRAIQQSSAVPQYTIQVCSYKPRYLQVVASFLTHADWEGRRKQIELEARRLLSEHYAFARRAFGQDVSISAVISLLQSIDGVLAVRIKQFYLQDDPAGRNALLVAELARVSSGTLNASRGAGGGKVDDAIQPAEVIVFAADDPTNLHLAWELQE